MKGSSFLDVLKADPAIEILLIGCGIRATLIKADILADIKSAGIAFESMDTGAACRTFNVLMSEDRRVAAALIPVG